MKKLFSQFMCVDSEMKSVHVSSHLSKNRRRVGQTWQTNFHPLGMIVRRKWLEQHTMPKIEESSLLIQTLFKSASILFLFLGFEGRGDINRVPAPYAFKCTSDEHLLPGQRPNHVPCIYIQTRTTWPIL